MKQPLICLLACLALLSCSPAIQNNSETEKSLPGKKFFEYDEIEYYVIGDSASEIKALCDNHSRSELDSIKFEVLVGHTPKDLSDLSFIDKMPYMGFRKQPIEKIKFNDIDLIFSEKPEPDTIALACKQVYRDILVFKKQQQVSGVAKICFTCKGDQLIGVKANTASFGFDSDFERLEKLLKK